MKGIMRSIVIKLKWLSINLFTLFLNLFIRRDEKIWLFGAWMGNRFADNPRFLYEYCCKHKKELGIKEVVWATRNQALYEQLKNDGYDVIKCGTKESLFYHLKAGYHVICNMYVKTGIYNGDIDGQWSIGAKKIQMWHGVGIKACNNSTNTVRELKHSEAKEKIKKIVDYTLLSPGGWSGCYWIMTSKENQRALSADFGIKDDRCIIANYARNSDEYRLQSGEIKVTELLEKWKSQGKKLIQYTPTFRKENDESNFIAPLNIDGFIDFLASNNFIWIEKRHLASTAVSTKHKNEKVFFLDSEFDIDVIMKYMDLVISDYSSVTSDAIIRHIPTLEYIPDYDNYRQCDRGFVADYMLYNPGYIVYKPADLMQNIKECLNGHYFDEDREKKYFAAKKLLFGENPRSTRWLMKQIQNATKQ